MVVREYLIITCIMESLPIKYLGLGLLLGAQFKSTAIGTSMLERMEKQLAGWKKRYLSKGGRITLIKSTPPAFLLIFYLCSPIPTSGSQIEKVTVGLFVGWLG